MNKRIFVVVAFLFLTILIWLQIIQIPTSVDLFCLSRNTEVPLEKVILFWTPMVNQRDWYMGIGSKFFQKCDFKNCYTTYDKNMLPIENFDAILFHGYEYDEKKFGKPDKRSPKQVYVFGNLEAPSRTPDYINKHNNFYNWTMTYRYDSDIRRTYGRIEARNTNYQPPSIEEIQKRRKKIAWFVSNCHTPSRREVLYDKLSKHLPIDVFGKCHQLKCPRENETECYNMIEKNYKFYLSFENSVCEDYVTEKLYKILRRNIVPIVYGGANYSVLLPPNSVINVMDFKSVKELVKYIKFLDQHPEEYVKYFEWKRNSASVSNPRYQCELCQKLNAPISPKTYPSISIWWKGINAEKCSDKFINNFL